MHSAWFREPKLQTPGKRTSLAIAFASGMSVIAPWSRLAGAIEGPVRIEGGLVASGLSDGPEVRIFKGIPYAASPTGSRRWRPPQPVTPWSGVRRAETFGPSAMQIPRSPKGLGYDGPYAFSENCLYLNIWTAAKTAAERRPVLVWIHGGGFVDGAGSLSSYDGVHLCRKGVVVVTINYRLNVFGFLAHPELSAESNRGVSGNYGLLDMIAAIKWTQRNIAAFGGDPRHIVIGGLSAGSAAVSALTASPLAKGDIVGAIGQSVVFGRRGLGGNLPTLDESERTGQEFAAAAGGRTVDELRALSTQAIYDAYVKMGGAGRWGPVIDKWVLPHDVFEAEERGGGADIPILTGSMQNEGTFLVRPVSARDFAAQSRVRFGEMAESFLAFYPARTEAEAAESQILSVRDQLAWMHLHWAQLHTRNHHSAYLYLFTREIPLPPAPHYGFDNRRLPDWLGAFHGACKLYSFASLASQPWPWTEADRGLADIMSSYWANFITKGNPNGPGLPAWPVFGSAPDSIMDLGLAVRPISSNLANAKAEFWAAFEQSR